MRARRSLTLSRLILLPSSPSIGCFGFELEEVCTDLGIDASVCPAAPPQPSLSHFGTRRRAPNGKSRLFAKKISNPFRALPGMAAPFVCPLQCLPRVSPLTPYDNYKYLKTSQLLGHNPTLTGALARFPDLIAAGLAGLFWLLGRG